MSGREASTWERSIHIRTYTLAYMYRLQLKYVEKKKYYFLKKQFLSLPVIGMTDTFFALLVSSC